MGFQFKKELAELVMAGTKTQTRRPVKGGDYFSADHPNGLGKHVSRNGRLLWFKGGIYAVQPGRGKSGIGHIQIANIATEDVRCITHEDAIAEGFKSQLDFLATWISFYDKGIWLDRIDYKTRDMQVGDWYMHCTERGNKWHQDSAAESFIWERINERPAELYQAYVISFKLVKPAEAVQS